MERRKKNPHEQALGLLASGEYSLEQEFLERFGSGRCTPTSLLPVAASYAAKRPELGYPATELLAAARRSTDNPLGHAWCRIAGALLTYYQSQLKRIDAFKSLMHLGRTVTTGIPGSSPTERRLIRFELVRATFLCSVSHANFAVAHQVLERASSHGDLLPWQMDFIHDRLAGVLIEQGRLDEAEKIILRIHDSSVQHAQQLNLERLRGNPRHDMEMAADRPPRFKGSFDFETELPLLAMACMVNLPGTKRFPLEDSWVLQEIARESASTNPWFRSLLPHLRALCLDAPVPKFDLEDPDNSYALRMANCLAVAKTSKPLAWRLWQKAINAPRARFGSASVSFPLLSSEPAPGEPGWISNLRAWIVPFERLPEIRGRQDVQIALKGSALTATYADGRGALIDLVNSPVSLRLVRALARARNTTTKGILHNATSRVPYDSKRHNPRIDVLLRLLAKRLEAAGFPRLWHKPGHQLVEIIHPISWS